jgi:hypothetical protein
MPTFQSGQKNAPWPAQGKLPIDNGGPVHTTLQVISGTVTFSAATASILSSSITATSQFIFTAAVGTTGVSVYVSQLVAGTGAVVNLISGTTGTYNYVIIG